MMKKRILMVMSALLMIAVGVCGCSSFFKKLAPVDF